MRELQVAIYARVSSESQAEAGTIASQLAALKERINQDGCYLLEELTFIDEGYSGSTLVRPALEKLRDIVSMHSIDRLYIHSPDRLARKYAYQVLLVDEFIRSGVEIIFLNRALGQDPEDELLLQVQGVVAEYERAKILERCRRGRRHAAKTGQVAVLSGAPYGYHYITKAEGGGQARYEIVLEEARVVRQMFTWIGQERLSIGEVCRRLKQAGELTRAGKTTWDRTTVWGILKNPAYKGTAAFGKTKVSSMKPRLRPQRGSPELPRRPVSITPVPKDDWIYIPVPALISEELFEAVQVQLEENRKRARQKQQKARHLLQGLLVCAKCQYSFYGKHIRSKTKGQLREYVYYRCLGTDANRFGGERVCDNLQVRTDKLDEWVWKEVCTLLQDPARLAHEYQRRLTQPDAREDLDIVKAQLTKLRQGIARLIDSYTEGFIDKQEFEPRIKRLRERLVKLEEQNHKIKKELSRDAELRLIITQLSDFAAKVKDSLSEADWFTKRDLIRMLVKRIEVGKDKVNIVFRVDPNPFDLGPPGDILQHCWRGITNKVLVDTEASSYLEIEKIRLRSFASVPLRLRMTD
ncbi:MAG TPA: recombinase family protein [Anaerolineae bacterium]|nr:recombinase family protein [Anaerolineae bacterium]